jgi:dihydroorotate dehydrogenase subfamily 2
MSILLSCLRLLPPELAHSVALNALKLLHQLNLSQLLFPHKNFQQVFTFKNLTFKNCLGIAAGLDKNGDFFDALGSLGFGFIEVGTVTPLPQKGNPKPRIFRFPSQHAIINRLGFNNKGVDYLVKKLQKRSYQGVLGVNIGSNKNSEGEKRIQDYIECFEKVAPFADYITVNISSPNTPNLRTLHAKENFIPLFSKLHKTAKRLSYEGPIFIKLSPDEEKESIQSLVLAIKQFHFDGIIVSNTTIKRENIAFHNNKDIKGGLSGKPLFHQSNKMLDAMQNEKELIKIGVGGVFTKNDLAEKKRLGASLVQIYTSFIYEGPQIVQKLLD